MKKKKIFILIILIVQFFEFCFTESKKEISFDPLSAINEFLPDSLRVLKENGDNAIEFCPDNTCDLFVMKKEVDEESFKDFVYLYVYFFSDFYILDEWRKRESSGNIARMILSKQRYKNIMGKTDIDKARSLLEFWGGGGRIEIYDVRYDECQRSVQKKELSEVLKKDRTK